MALTREQQAFLSENFNHTHGELGHSEEAAREVDRRLSQVDTNGFTRMDVAEWHGELASQVVVLFKSAVKKAQTPIERTQLLEYAGQGIIEHYPVAQTLKEVEIRQDYWVPVFGEVDAHMRCLRDLVNFFILLCDVPMDDESFAKTQALLATLRGISDAQVSESGKRILRIEDGSRAQAVFAFLQFMRHDLLHDFLHHRSEMIAVGKKFLKKMVLGNNRTMETPQYSFAPMQKELLQQFLAISFIAMSRTIYSL